MEGIAVVFERKLPAWPAQVASPHRNDSLVGLDGVIELWAGQTKATQQGREAKKHGKQAFHRRGRSLYDVTTCSFGRFDPMESAAFVEVSFDKSGIAAWFPFEEPAIGLGVEPIGSA